VSLPLHPDQHMFVSAEYISNKLLANHHVNKLLYVQAQEMEPVIVENGWLCRMDMALLHNPLGHDALRQTIVQCATGSNLIMVLHDADETGCRLSQTMQNWLKESQLDPAIIVDLGLELNAGDTDNRVTRLVQMMPNELAAWLTRRFEALGIECKSMPPFPDVRHDISERFEKLLLGHLWEGVSQQFEVTRLIRILETDLQFVAAMHKLALDQSVKHHLYEDTPRESYAAVLDRVVRDFFHNFMQQHADRIDEIVLTHLAKAPGK